MSAKADKFFFYFKKDIELFFVSDIMLSAKKERTFFMSDIIKIGVLGAGRGRSMIQYASKAENAKLVAICDYSDFQIERVKNKLNDDSISYYTSFHLYYKYTKYN